MLKKLSALVLLFFVYSSLFSKVEPGVKYLEISSGQFTIIFPAKYKTEATKLLKDTPAIYNELAKYWGNTVKGRIRVLLTDNRDYSNGSATFFPFNTIEIFMKPPAAETSLGKYSNWINMVLCHELTHLINFHSSNGFLRFMRKITGTNPFFYPVAVLPGWFLEGTAVYSESDMFESGRLNTSNYKNILTISSTNNTTPDWFRLDGLYRRWPGGSAQYIYGAGLMNYLSREYGKNAPAEIISQYIKEPLVLPVEYTLKKYTGKTTRQLWQDYTDSYKTELKTSSADSITSDGFSKGAPVSLADNSLVYSYSNHKEYPGLYRHNKGRGEYLNRQSGINSRLSLKNGKIWYSALSAYRGYATYSDIYYYIINKGKTVRVTKGKRLFSPVPYKNRTLCIKRENNSSHLVWLNRDRSTKRVSGNYENIQDLTVSTNNLSPLLAYRETGKNYWKCGILDTTTGKLKSFTPDGINCYSPLWTDKNDILFIGETRGQTYLYNYNMDTESINRAENINPYQLGESSEKNLIFSAYSTKGIDLLNIDIDKVRWTKADNSEEQKPAPGSLPELEAASKNYNPVRDLVPHYFAPGFRNGGDEFQPGIIFSGNDVLQRHTYFGELYYGFRSRKPGFRMSYYYDGLAPTFATSVSNLYKRHSGGITQHNSKINTGLFFNLITRNRFTLRLYTGYYRERVEFSGSRNSGTDLGGLKTALLFNSAKNYRDSISAADGLKFTLSYTRDQRELGSDYNINTISFDYRHYFSISKPVTAAIRVGFADSGGEAGKLFSIGGKGEVEIPAIASSDIFTLLRGYPSGYEYGTGGWIMNCELRIPLFDIERGYWFVHSFERVWLTLFFDAGNLWMRDIKIDPLKSVGGELNLRLRAGILQMTLSAGLAFPLDTGSAKIYFRIGSSL